MTRTELQHVLEAILTGRPYAQQDARQLVSHVSGATHADLLAFPERPVSRRASLRAQHLAVRRGQEVPMAYLLGTRDFYGRSFIVNRHVLIPRPETETLIEHARTLLPADLVIDIGTGSGAIALTLALETGVPVIATDTSRQALRVAKRNARQFGVSSPLQWRHGSLLQPIRNTDLVGDHLIITANLPYLTPELLTDSPFEVTHYEPWSALISDQTDGLDLSAQLLTQLTARRSAFPSHIDLLLEIDPRQAPLISTRIALLLPNSTTHVLPDLSGNPRILWITTKNER